ncbi:hypothetical protein XELAEV_18006061mg [Xenopus laevis]|uniref:Uncharacterized protein n=1 Tax=Xenopus laevis TaxID=8355 RepID=A0A974I384_XENLA|nr:hypothetical protein XELAEV_18006061mg [Xenopus laevis]
MTNILVVRQQYNLISGKSLSFSQYMCLFKQKVLKHFLYYILLDTEVVWRIITVLSIKRLPILLKLCVDTSLCDSPFTFVFKYSIFVSCIDD